MSKLDNTGAKRVSPKIEPIDFSKLAKLSMLFSNVSLFYVSLPSKDESEFNSAFVMLTL